ncbi:hypothetical protein HYPSUDRAFT_36453 [Hypholoma sublateritium FD-334 SS-4]|uniref:YDG domain-containing protein n=1 Tax=Hypholoma sublateritium (strain FD-334 SS-4) TaxID=945553 RepID=A0A0D2P5M7_HYPSF|nr:hypothetical protein HYPSUDRAFT_36453 [Hypholoma sublateritium FD-334 SS-4]
MPGFKGTAMKPAPGRNPCRFGEIPGFPVGSRWAGRRELCDAGVHAHLSNGIHGRTQQGAYSVVLSGGYEDDIDLGYEFTYTGQGGQGKRTKGIKWNNIQIADQEWTLGNLSLAISSRTKKPVRVIRGHTLNSAYAPAEGYQYDGLYTVQNAEMKKGKRGFAVCLFRFVRCPGQVPLSGPIATLPISYEELLDEKSTSKNKPDVLSCSKSPSRDSESTSSALEQEKHTFAPREKSVIGSLQFKKRAQVSSTTSEAVKCEKFDAGK